MNRQQDEQISTGEGFLGMDTTPASVGSSYAQSGWKRFYYRKYPNTPHIACINVYKDNVKSNKATGTCFVQFIKANKIVYAYPVMKQWEGTNCSEDTSRWGLKANGTWTDLYDHTFDLLLGLLVFVNKSDAYDFAREAYQLRADSAETGDLILANKLYNAMRSIIDNSINSASEPFNFSRGYLCGYRPSGVHRNCFLVTINQYGPGYEATPTGYPLFAGACRNSVFNSTSFLSLTQKTPEPLVQQYYECTLKPYDSFFAALGLSLGNADVYAKWAFFIWFGLYMFYIRRAQGVDPGMTSWEPCEERSHHGGNKVIPT